jgi:hypothetical protein
MRPWTVEVVLRFREEGTSIRVTARTEDGWTVKVTFRPFDGYVSATEFSVAPTRREAPDGGLTVDRLREFTLSKLLAHGRAVALRSYLRPNEESAMRDFCELPLGKKSGRPKEWTSRKLAETAIEWEAVCHAGNLTTATALAQKVGYSADSLRRRINEMEAIGFVEPRVLGSPPVVATDRARSFLAR